MIRFFILIITTVLFWMFSMRNDMKAPDETVQKTIAYQDRIYAYRARIEDFGSDGKKRAEIEYVVDGQNWIMKSVTTNNTMFEWRKIDSNLYVLNADTGWFWKIANSTFSLPWRVSVHDAIAEVQDALVNKKIRVQRIGSDPCGKHLCFRYQFLDPSFAIVERYWWIGTSEYRLMKDQFVIGNGETSITSYDYEGEIEIEIPKLTKDAPSDTDIMTLPGIVKNLLTPKPQKSV